VSIPGSHRGGFGLPGIIDDPGLLWLETDNFLAEDYLVAGRNIHPAVMSLSYGATFISTSAIVGFGGVAGLFGFSLLWLTVLNISWEFWWLLLFLALESGAYP
jgi:Na+/proline symporter